MNKYIAFKQEDINSPQDLEKYSYFIVHAIEEFRVYNRQTFMKRFKDFKQIINLYCIDEHEELRFNGQNWLRIFETRKKDHENTFEFQLKEEKCFTIAEQCGDSDLPIQVCKYYLKPGTAKFQSDEILVVPEIPIIYRHSLKTTKAEV